MKKNKQNKKSVPSGAKKNKPLFKKTPKAVLFVMLLLALAMLALMLLFQMGLLFDWGFTALTSDVVVMAITVSMVAFGLLSLVGIVRAFTTDYANAALSQNLLSSYDRIEGREDDREYQASHGNEMPVKVHDTVPEEKYAASLPVEQSEAVEPEEAPIPSGEDALQDEFADEPQQEIPAEEGQNFDQALDYASDDEIAQPVDEAENVAAETPIPVEQNAELEKQINKFETTVKHMLETQGISKELYVINDYVENAVCLSHDELGYFIGICRDNCYDEAERFPFSEERAVVTRFFERIAMLLPAKS